MSVAPARPSPVKRGVDGPRGKLRPRGNLWFLFHSWLGLKLSFFLLLVLVTGSIATVSHEIDWIVDERVRAARQGAILEMDRLFARVEAAYPDAFIAFSSVAPGEGNIGGALAFASIFHVTTPDGAYRDVYVDPYSGEIKGERAFSFPDFIRQFHYNLFVPKGLFLTTLLGFFLLGSLVTGLVTYKKFWRGFLRVPRRRRGSRVFWGDIHRLIGLWSLWFALIISVTSIWYLAEEILNLSGVPMYEEDAPTLSLSDLDSLGPDVGGPMPLRDLLRIARERLPGLEVREVMRLGHPLQAVRIGGQTDAVLVRDRTTHIYLNPYNGETLRSQRAEDLSAFWRWVHTADVLHFGTFGGIGTKILWFVFGLLLSTIALSGTIIYLKRTVKAAHTLLPRAGEADPHAGRLFHWLGRWQWINIVLVLLPLIGFAAQSYSDDDQAARRSLGAQAVGPWQVELTADEASSIEDGLLIGLRFCGGCFRQAKSVFIGWDRDPGAPHTAKLVQGNPYDLEVRLPARSTADPGEIRLTVLSWNGESYEARMVPYPIRLLSEP